MSAMEKSMKVSKYLHLLAGSAIVQLVIVFGGAIGSLTMPGVALAWGECVWQGGPGAPQYPQCKVEDCKGAGGNAECQDPKPGVAPPLTASQLGPDYWIYNICDEFPPHLSRDARWCTAAGGDWVLSSGGNPSCVNLPPEILGGGGTSMGDEDLAVSISDTFAGGFCSATNQSDTGWGVFVDQYSFCSYGGTSYVNDIEVDSCRLSEGRDPGFLKIIPPGSAA